MKTRWLLNQAIILIIIQISFFKLSTIVKFALSSYNIPELNYLTYQL